jgi:hypothetical protein
MARGDARARRAGRRRAARRGVGTNGFARAMCATLASVAAISSEADALGGDAGDDRGVADARDGASMHTVFSTECNGYFDWQSYGLYDGWRRVGQRGKFTRLMACDDENSPSLRVVPDTHVHPNYATHPVTKDSYTAYNKPFSIHHWLTNAEVTADFIIVLDADMIFRAPMTVDLLGVRRGAPVSAKYGYLIGTQPESHMGVKARVRNVEKAQQVGGFTVMHREDMRKLAPRWLYWTEEVRQDPDSWANTGDIYNANGKYGPPWISEMYGYVFAAAEVGITFQVHDDFMLYPGYDPPSDSRFPVVLHYGLTFNVQDYAFDKQWFHRSVLGCPTPELFQRPPTLAELRSKGPQRRRDEVALVCAWGLYNATRQYAIERCGIANPIDTRKIHYSCSKDARGVLSCGERKNTDDTFRGGGGDDDEEECRDTNDMCCGWAHDGECEKNPSFMLQSCPRSCDTCTVRCESRCCPPEKEAVKEETETQNDLNKPMNDGASTVRDDKVEDELHSFEDAREDEPLRAVEKDFATTPDDESGWYTYWHAFLISSTLLFCVVRIRLALKRRARRRSRHYVVVRR